MINTCYSINDSFPALPSSALIEQFGNDEDQVTIECQRKNSPFYARYERFFCYDHEATAAGGISPARSNFVARAIDERLERRIAEIALLRQKGKKSLEIYYGSQFWALTSKSVDVILDFVANDRHLQKSFEYSALPDEIMFQSILGNHIHKKRMETGPVYVDFSAGGPRVMNALEDIPRDLQQPHAFIRKFSPTNQAFLSDMALRLQAGKTMGGATARCVPVVQQTMDQAGRAFVTIRLAASAKNADPCWQE